MKEITLNEDQHKASIRFTEFLIDPEAKFMVISGSAGTGKSTLVKHLLKTMESRLNLYATLPGSRDSIPKFSIDLTATTNKAAAVLSDLSDNSCSTVHSRLGLIPLDNYETGETEFIKGRKHEKIYNTLLVVDESSFVDDKLFNLIDESAVDCKVLFIGDKYQLAPPNQISTILEKIDGYTVNLEKVMRHSGIIAHSGARFRETVKTGIFEPILVDGEYIVHVNGPTFQAMIDNEFTSKDYHADKARVLAWQNITVNKYNSHIRQIMDHSPQFGIGDVLATNRPIMTSKGTIAPTEATVEITRLGEESIQMDIAGRWVQIEEYSTWFFLPHNQIQAGSLMKSLSRQKKWGILFDIKKKWLDLRPAFASTVHKSQGSTYDTVYINLTDIGKCRVPSDVARMMYVAITRAAKKVVLYGELPFIYSGAYHAKEHNSGVPA